jgi:glycosyltransferase involved in cell wall biosynthesis
MKTVVHIQDFALPKFDVYSDKNRLFDRIRKLQYWHALRKVNDVNFVTVNLEHTRQEYITYFPEYDVDRVLPLELGIDIEFSENEVNHEEILEKYMIGKNDWKNRGYIIYLGGDIVKTKNSEAVVKGYSKFKELYKYKFKNDNYPYLLIAGKEFTNLSRKRAVEFQKLVHGLKLTNDVVFTNFYENKEKYTLLSNAKCFVHFSKYEGFGLALLEAMLSKVPIVVSNIFPYKYILENDDY